MCMFIVVGFLVGCGTAPIEDARYVAADALLENVGANPENQVLLKIHYSKGRCLNNIN